MTKPIILTGIRANNNLTIGNYFGGMLPIIDMAKHRSADYQVNMFIPDLHSITTRSICIAKAIFRPTTNLVGFLTVLPVLVK